jgi:hypothetical protein
MVTSRPFLISKSIMTKPKETRHLAAVEAFLSLFPTDQHSRRFDPADMQSFHLFIYFPPVFSFELKIAFRSSRRLYGLFVVRLCASPTSLSF